MMRAVFPLLALLAGCAPVAGAGDRADRVAEELAGRAAGAPERCVIADTGQAIRIADRRTLIYRRGDTLWVNRLGRDCFAAGPLNTLIIENLGGNYCNGDRVRGREPGSSVPGPTCLLGDWVPYRRPS